MMPIWIHLSNVPPHLWNPSGLSHIANIIGSPLHLDPITEAQERFFFARVCVEISPNSHLPHIIPIKLRNGKIYSVKVSYPWKPPLCHSCSSFDHNTSNCPKSQPPSSTANPPIANRSLHSSPRSPPYPSTAPPIPSFTTTTTTPTTTLQTPSVTTTNPYYHDPSNSISHNHHPYYHDPSNSIIHNSQP